MNYGMKAQKLSFNLGISVEEAEALMDKYMATWPAVRRFFSDTQQELESSGYVYSFIGRRRYLPDVASPQAWKRWRAGRQAANFIIQSTAADIARFAMLRIVGERKLAYWGWRMLSQVHDEILFEGPQETLEEVLPIIKESMENPFRGFSPIPFAAPLRSTPAKGANWHEAK